MFDTSLQQRTHYSGNGQPLWRSQLYPGEFLVSVDDADLPIVDFSQTSLALKVVGITLLHLLLVAT
ncbi:MAG: hypothetical protein AAF892_01880 [Cyanobacteria bacterium P01_D01_bin.71]